MGGDDVSGEPLEEALGVESMDLESQMMLKEDLEEKLKAGKKLTEKEMDLAEELLGERILEYLKTDKGPEADIPKEPLPEEKEAELEQELIRKALVGDEGKKEDPEEELFRVAKKGK